MSEHGGKREGAGRKPKDVELKELELIDASVSDEDWARIITSAKAKAISGDIAAMKLLFERRFGKIVEIKADTGGDSVTIIMGSADTGTDNKG